MGFVIMAAEAAGLGTCPISYVRSHVEKVGPLFGLPEGVFPVAGLTLAVPEARNEPRRACRRTVVSHRERYDDGGLPAALAGLRRAAPAAEAALPGGARPEARGLRLERECGAPALRAGALRLPHLAATQGLPLD